MHADLEVTLRSTIDDALMSSSLDISMRIDERISMVLLFLL